MKLNYLILVGVVLMLLPRSPKNLPRGIRNNNAGNIRLSNDKWEGLAREQNDDSFFQFVSPEYGIRAIAKILKTYKNKYGINTVAGVIDRWAPPNENNTDSYKKHVSQLMGVNQYEIIDLDERMFGLVEGIILHENGQNPYSLKTVLDGLKLA